MKENVLKAISFWLVATLALGALLAFPIAPAYAASPIISVLNPDATHDLTLVDPTYWTASYTYDTKYDGTPAGLGDIIFHSDTHAGDIFYISVYLTDVTDLWLWQIKLWFDPGLLQCTEAFIPPDSPFKFSITPSPYIDNTAGYVMMGSSHLAGEPGVSGSGELAWIVFEVVQEAAYGEYYSGDFTFDAVDTYLWDPEGIEMPFTTEPGHYEIFWVVPVTYPYYEVYPAEYKATALGEDVKIDIYVKNVDAAWEIIGFQFVLAWNSTLLEAVGYEEGTFMESFLDFGETVLYADGHDYHGDAALPLCYEAFTIGVIIIPGEGNVWHAPFPEGEGLLVSLHFTAIYETVFPEEAWTDLSFTYLENNPYFEEDNFYPLALNQYMEEIPISIPRCIGGMYRAPVTVVGRMIDVFTQYPDGFNGKGPNEPSDMFWPQKEVILYANATYNEWPEQNKDVAFQIIDPYGETWAIYSNKTDENGIAWVRFRLPWPCDDPEYWFGEWSVVATVDIACVVVNDTLTFHYDYLVHIWKVTTDKTEYAHCEFIEVAIEYGTHAMQEYDVVITLTANDETGVPFGFTYVRLTVGGATYCEYKNYSTSLSVHVVKFARAGTAKLYVCALSDFPSKGGYAIYDYEPVKVYILPEYA